MKRCVHCLFFINEAAMRCPHCSSYQGQWGFWHRSATVIGPFLPFASVLAVLFAAWQAFSPGDDLHAVFIQHWKDNDTHGWTYLVRIANNGDRAANILTQGEVRLLTDSPSVQYPLMLHWDQKEEAMIVPEQAKTLIFLGVEDSPVRSMNLSQYRAELLINYVDHKGDIEVLHIPAPPSN